MTHIYLEQNGTISNEMYLDGDKVVMYDITIDKAIDLYHPLKRDEHCDFSGWLSKETQNMAIYINNFSPPGPPQAWLSN